jgi:hypothetical protein
MAILMDKRDNEIEDLRIDRERKAVEVNEKVLSL